MIRLIGELDLNLNILLQGMAANLLVIAIINFGDALVVSRPGRAERDVGFDSCTDLCVGGGRCDGAKVLSPCRCCAACGGGGALRTPTTPQRPTTLPRRRRHRHRHTAPIRRERKRRGGWRAHPAACTPATRRHVAQSRARPHALPATNFRNGRFESPPSRRSLFRS